jgi:hypothetical protein
MHQYRTIAQTLFVLSILNFVFAAPAVPREAHDTRNDVAAKDVTGVSERRRGLPPSGGKTLGQDLSSPPDGPPTYDLSGMDNVPLRDSMEASTSEHPLSAADGTAPVPDSNTGASTSSDPSSATNRPVSVPGSTAEGSTTTHYTQVTHDMLEKEPKFYQKPLVKKIAGLSLIGSVVAAIVLFSALNNKHKDD